MDNNQPTPREDLFRPVELLSRVASLSKPSSVVFPLGISHFDKIMDGGVRDGELIVISGETGQGKTTFAQVLTTNLDKKKVPSLWFSYEMSPYYLYDKFVQMGQRSDSLIYSPIELTENTVKFVEQQIDTAVNDFACKVVFIDHLHYLIPLNQSANASLLIGGVVRELKRLAIKKNIIIFLIAHTKKIYKDEELSLSSIRDSSLIAQESDFVFLIERVKKAKEALFEGTDSEWTNQTKVALAKNRRTGKMLYITCDYRDNKLIPIDYDLQDTEGIQE